MASAAGTALVWDGPNTEFDVRISTDIGNILGLGTDGGLLVTPDGLAVTSQPRGRIGRSGGVAQSIPNNTPTVVTFDAAITNTGPTWSAGNPNRLTAPVSGGYDIGSTIRFLHNGSAAVEQGVRQVALRLNGTTIVAESAVPPVRDRTTTVQATTSINLTAGDYMEVLVEQTEGAPVTLPIGTLPASPVAWMYYTTEGT